MGLKRPRQAPPRLLLPFLALFAGLSPGCTQPWRPVTWLEGLRVLAIRAEPPDLAPGEQTALTALVVDPRSPTRESTLLWLSCDPDPLALDQPTCAQFATLQEADELVAGATLPEGVKPLGLGATVLYQAPADVFGHLAADDLRRRRGVIAMVVLVAVAEAPPAGIPTEDDVKALLKRVQDQLVDSVLAVKRLRISEDQPLNLNPQIQGIRFGEELWGPGVHPIKLRPGTTADVVGVAVDGSAQHFVQIDPDGQSIEKDEKLFFSWFSTAGSFEASRSEEGLAYQTFTPPNLFDAMPPDRSATLWVVMRDGRGGVDWQPRSAFFCDPFLAAARVDAISPASGPTATIVTLRGAGLEGVLDVQVGAAWLANLHYQAGTDVLTGFISSETPAGTQQVTVRGKSCLPDSQTSFEVTR